MLLHKDAIETLIAMAEQAEASLFEEFGLPLGLIVIDTIAAAPAMRAPGTRMISAVVPSRHERAQSGCGAVVLLCAGRRSLRQKPGGGSKAASVEGGVVRSRTGLPRRKELSGNVTNTRLAVRKCRGGQQGREFPFVLRGVNAPEPDEDGEADHDHGGGLGRCRPGGAQAPPDPWAQGRRQDQRTAALRLKRVLMSVLADQGVELPIPPDGPMVRMVDSGDRAGRVLRSHAGRRHSGAEAKDPASAVLSGPGVG